MNAIQQISLKLQMGINPAIDIQPEMLRAIWRELTNQRYESLQAHTSTDEFTPTRISHPTLSRAG